MLHSGKLKRCTDVLMLSVSPPSPSPSPPHHLDSVMVKVGPQDYWSQRMSAFTGRPHRVLFDETMEKIYSRLYQEASQLH